MLAAGASPNVYSASGRRTPLQAAAGMLKADIVELLLEEGAEVNAAAKGHCDITALQAACMSFSGFTEPDDKRLKIIQYLLARDANLNAAPACRGGHTALQASAATGDLAVAKLLLLQNPMADFNAPPCQGKVGEGGRGYVPLELGTALDIAAEHGRLDMVKLLLSCNALSHRRGENVYDGAIFLAEKKGHLGVADLIREHAKNEERLPIHLRNPYLSEPPRHWSEYGYKRDLDEDSDRSCEADSAEYDSIDDDSDSSIGTGAGILCAADEREPPGALQETHSIAHLDANQTAEAVYKHSDLSLQFQGHDVATLHPMYASQQMDFGTSMDLDMILGSGNGKDLGVAYADPLDHELDASERLIYDVDGDCE